MIDKIVELFRKFLEDLFKLFSLPVEEPIEHTEPTEPIVEEPINDKPAEPPVEVPTEPTPTVPVDEIELPVTKTIEELALEVLDGKWGNGDKRKANLTEAGYDYEAVQEKVNEIIAEREAKQKAEEEEAARIAAEKAAEEHKALILKLANEVLEGKWGSGDKRKENLEAAGYNYNEVQAQVNEILRVVQEVLDGKWGTGDTRKQRLTEAGYDYDTIQNQINRQYEKENP